MIRYHNEKQLGENDLFTYTSISQFIIDESKVRNCRGHERVMLTAVLHRYGLVILLSYRTQNQQLRGVITHSNLGPLISLINQKCSSQASLVKTFSQLGFLLLK